jgi:F-type H+-transporting ATPase subunit epsilon
VASETTTLRCLIVAPEQTLFDEAVEFVAVPLHDGELGILPGRAPLIGRLGYGELRVTRGGEMERFYIDGGFVQVNGNVVSVLTNRASAAANIDPEAAAGQLQTALSRVPTTDAEFTAKSIALARARAQLTVAARAGRG